MIIRKIVKIAPILIVLLLVVNILFVGVLISTKDQDKQVDVFNNNPTPEATGITTPIVTETQQNGGITAMTPLDIGQRQPGSIETIDLVAQPITDKDSVAMIRLYIKNGEVLEFKSTGLMAFGTCYDNKTYTPERVCVDIAKTTPFITGEKLGTIKVKWSVNGSVNIEEGHGYYNGEEVSFVNKEVSYASIAGLETESKEYFTEGVILIIVSGLILFTAMVGAYIILSQEGPKANLDAYKKGRTVIKVLVGSSIFMLAGATVFVANMIATKNQAPEEASALTLTPVYIMVTTLPEGGNTIVPSITVSVTGTLAPTNSVIPTLSSSPVVTLSPTATPTSTPYPTLFTDNVPMVCGPIDSNGDRILNYIDYQAMIVVYNRSCSDTYPEVGCGGKDTNRDGVVNYIDMHYLVNHQFPTYTDCTRY